jgi:hypothetical protein
MAALLRSPFTSDFSSRRADWRLPGIEMGSQFAFPENQPDRPFAEGVVGFLFERLKGIGFSCASFGHFISFSSQLSVFSSQLFSAG